MPTYTTNKLTSVSADAVQIKCPYCECEGFYTIKDQRSPFVVLCEADYHGCDRYFVASVRFSAIVTTAGIVEDE